MAKYLAFYHVEAGSLLPDESFTEKNQPTLSVFEALDDESARAHILEECPTVADIELFRKVEECSDL